MSSKSIIFVTKSQTKYEDKMNELSRYTLNSKRIAYQLALLGCTDREIARVMDVSVETLDAWKRKHLDFREELQKGKTEADGRVAESLYRRAIGCSVKDVHIALFRGKAVVTPYTKHYPPDTAAAIKWLALRQKEKWSEVQRTEILQTNVNILKIDLSKYTTEELAFIERIQHKAITENAGDN
jgi:hypothetical protein